METKVVSFEEVKERWDAKIFEEVIKDKDIQRELQRVEKRIGTLVVVSAAAFVQVIITIVVIVFA